MKKFLDTMRDNVIHKYGFEATQTIIVFQIAEKIEKIFRIGA